MFPNWQTELGVPTAGDDVIIKSGDIITVDTNTPKGEFTISVQPKSLDGVLKEHAKNIELLISCNHSYTVDFLNQYINYSSESDLSGELKVKFKNILENHRSSLEYVAHYLVDYCSPRPDINRVQFPVSNLKDDESTFSTKLDKWFPGLGSKKPNIKKFLISVQHFNGETWLRDLAELSNFNKHHTLSSLEVKNFESKLIYFYDVGVRLGNLGLNSLTLEEKGKINFQASNGRCAGIYGQCQLSVNNIPTATFDREIKLLREVRPMHYISPLPNSLAHTLWAISKNVYRTVNNVCALLS